ncbi:hypothetical protein HPB52_011017 [Rhipicephalus sanguineus]|uniref:Endonuclease/exonuclease/phosphatase domain-containing protein n=1 Tax=Rhipicephalus sanguineus TaxID=34632 RepID=A0A9D4Q679_RHISA|nr:hypothetical protein HPB52_011017 [Rhipicephalus sanguineus]
MELLQEFIKPNQPDIIALQETNTQNVRLQGYMTCAQTQRTAILVKKALSVQKHEIEQTQTEHTLIEILPERKTQQSLFIANVYSPPRDQLPDFDHFVREIRKRTNGHQVVIVGDFNASHTAWGYHITSKKGSRVHDAAQHHRLTLWNDPLQKTRIGNSVSRDTNPDLTFTANVTGAEWSVLPETLGSDHHILQLDVAHTRRQTKTGIARLTDWKFFRDDLDVETTITDIDEWFRNAQRHTGPVIIKNRVSESREQRGSVWRQIRSSTGLQRPQLSSAPVLHLTSSTFCIVGGFGVVESRRLGYRSAPGAVVSPIDTAHSMTTQEIGGPSGTERREIAPLGPRALLGPCFVFCLTEAAGKRDREKQT